MDVEKLMDLPITDCHVHVAGGDLEAMSPASPIEGRLNLVDALLAQERVSGISRVAILISGSPDRLNANAEGLHAKIRHPQEIYLFAGLDYSAIASNVDHRYTCSLAEQVDRLAAMGCDGLKMLDGKPDFRKASGIALDSVVYEPLFGRLEERGFPLLWHVNDPEEFWNPEEAPEWARGPGWLYDESYPSYESIYSECERVLDRHPKLNVILAHFYFLSDDLLRAASLLERYPNVKFDLAPGIEMLHNFSKRPEATREFFLKYRDRIVFGTDFAPGGRDSRLRVVRHFLETDEEFHVPTDEPLFWPDHRTMIQGIALPEAALRRIYADNFEAAVAPAPRPLDRDLILEEINRLTALRDALCGGSM